MRRPPTPKTTDLAALLSRASGLPLEEVRATMGAAGAPPAVLDPPPSRALRAALAEREAEAAAPDRTPLEERAEALRRRVEGEKAPSRPKGKRPALERPAGREFLEQLHESGRTTMRPLDWQPQDFAAARSISRSSRAAARALSTLPKCYAQRVERAALAMMPLPDGSRRPTRDWRHIEARRVVALAVVIWRASRVSKRRGMARILVGRTRGMFCSLFENAATLAPYSQSTLFATMRHDGSPWDCGTMVALHRAGALWRHQPPAACAAPEFRGKDRNGIARAFNEYHLSARVASEVTTADALELVDQLPDAPPAAAASDPP